VVPLLSKDHEVYAPTLFGHRAAGHQRSGVQ
jgi:hypothetical protein